MAMLNNQRVPAVPAPLYPGIPGPGSKSRSLRMTWRSSPMWVGREPRAELHALSRFSQVSTRTAFSFRVVDFPGEEYFRKDCQGNNINISRFQMIPDGNNISWYPSFVMHFFSCFTSNLIRQVFAPLRRRRMPWASTWTAGDANCGAPWDPLGVLVVSACFSLSAANMCYPLVI